MECVTLRDGVVATIYNGFTNLEIKRDFKVIINCYNRRNSSPSSNGGYLETFSKSKYFQLWSYL